MEITHTAPAMQLIVGHEQLQFVFVDSKTAPQKVVGVYPEFVGGRIRIRAAGLFLKHMTMGVKAITSRRDPSQYRYWEMADFTSDGLAADKVYRLYARVPVSGESGTFVLHDTFKGMNDEAGAYLLLMGYLGAEREGNRSWGRAYGFTEILPGQITTELIQDPNAQLVIDLANGRITGPLTITAGSVGYNNLTDKPDLTGYLTKSEFKVTADQIRAEVGGAKQAAGETKQQLEAKLAAFQTKTQQDSLALLNRQSALEGSVHQLQTAGFMTTEQGNVLYASAKLNDGREIASRIVQTPGAINLISQHINLDGYVTVGALSKTNEALNKYKDDLQKQINGKQSNTDTIQLNRIKYGNVAILDSNTGKITNTMIDTDKLKVNEAAQIGSYIVNGDALTVKGFNPYYGKQNPKGISISPTTGIKLKGADAGFTDIQGGSIAIDNGSLGALYLSYGGISLSKGVETWFGIEYSHIQNDPDWKSYVQLKVKPLPHKNHIAYMPGGHDFKHVVIDINTGLMGWE